MEIYPGAHLIEGEIVGRPLYLPLLTEESTAMLIDCGTRLHAAENIPAYISKLGLSVSQLRWLVITHPDGDHCGGSATIKQRYPEVEIVCGNADRRLVESPEYLFDFRYDAYRANHGIFFDSKTAAEIKNCSSVSQDVAITMVGGETIRLGPNRVLEIWHLPGHSHGHLGVYDRNCRTLYYGDAIQGAGYRSLQGDWALCPTYLYVDAYLQTIRAIELSPAETIIGCHWPVLRGKDAILQFCAESRNFVLLADRLITEYLADKPMSTMKDLCENLGPRLGDWPESVNLELANAISGHLDRGVSQGCFEVDQTERPFRYKISERH